MIIHKVKKSKVYNKLLSEFNGALREKIEEWLRYKTERHEAYHATGFQNFISEIVQRRKTFSDEQICQLLSECMANGWKGVVWDKLGRQGQKNSSVLTAGSSIDKNELDALIQNQFAEG